MASVLLAAIAVGYLMPRFGYVNNTFGLLSSIGNFFSNARARRCRAVVSPRLSA